jgi:hypothetical protein
MTNTDEILSLLHDIKARLERIEARGGQPASAPASGGEVATDHELSGEHGNPVVKYDPKRWTGRSYAGSRMSECPSDYLEAVAEFNDWRVGDYTKNGKDPKWPALDARRARGWARRNAGKPAPTADDAAGNYPADDLDDSNIPF